MADPRIRGADRPAPARAESHDPSPALGPAFRRAMLRWTALYWAGVYLLFTARSLLEPRPPLLTQAGLRLVMMAVGLSLSIALIRMLRRIDVRQWPRELGLLAVLGMAANGVYIGVNFLVFYVLPDLWQPEHGAAAKIGSYTVELFWLFPAWIALYLGVARRHVAADPGAASPRLDSLWIADRGRQVRVPLDGVDRIEAEGDYVRIHSGERSHLLRSTMARMERTLDPARFVRVHRGAIVAAPLLESVEREADGRMMVTLANGRRVPVGRNYVKRVRELTRPEPPSASAS